jgi:Activator of Hsp90 ATPase homolog 1-like protein
VTNSRDDVDADGLTVERILPASVEDVCGEGVRLDHTGEYLVLEPPHRLVFTWISTYTGSQPSIIKVMLTPHSEGTHLVLSHDRLPQGAAAAHQGGWATILERLASALALHPALCRQPSLEDWDDVR